MIEMLTKDMMVIILQYISVSYQYIIYLKFTQCYIYVNYISKLGEKVLEKIVEIKDRQ